ncbi:hypothetical protein IX307_001195 [Bacteroides pyogenes]|uniref:Uncharacterized protein n=1 Tax=Bacteroides pyogenes F0041 TaxID=1321819 RepID=U2CBM5_9BACE|nr:hypothetical protein [Bacteroides pyogenes]ERI81418.1 hypothetical protein HMPREF1981_03182 [Bacteroides pyogenes F0041]MBR8719919.1 hypothetical protein [Bacteroides pyogenes]MBR8786881.1 hypothetical protein [Bacteroides pyogenes]MBR8792365.1 hypothetical protein [Bacteroides pyogenes]
MKKEITENEWELIETIRNFKKVYPPSVELEIYIYSLLDVLMERDGEKDEEK